MHAIIVQNGCYAILHSQILMQGKTAQAAFLCILGTTWVISVGKIASWSKLNSLSNFVTNLFETACNFGSILLLNNVAQPKFGAGMDVLAIIGMVLENFQPILDTNFCTYGNVVSCRNCVESVLGLCFGWFLLVLDASSSKIPQSCTSSHKF